MRTEQIRHARHRLIGCFFFPSFLKDEQNKARDKLAGAKKTTDKNKGVKEVKLERAVDRAKEIIKKCCMLLCLIAGFRSY
jgi:hypothetical protein